MCFYTSGVRARLLVFAIFGRFEVSKSRDGSLLCETLFIRKITRPMVRPIRSLGPGKLNVIHQLNASHPADARVEQEAAEAARAAARQYKIDAQNAADAQVGVSSDVVK
jgi:hypothetical protein